MKSSASKANNQTFSNYPFMARIRTIKPEFWTDEKIGNLRREARLLFIALWNFADDKGTVRANPVLIKSQIFPYDEDLRVDTLNKWLAALVDARMLEPFTLNGESFYNIRTFLSHQKIDRPSKPLIAAELKEELLAKKNEKPLNPRRVFGEHSPQEREREEDMEIEPKGSPGLQPGAVAPKPDLYSRLETKDLVSVAAFIRKYKPASEQPYVDLWNLFAKQYGMAKLKALNDKRRRKLRIRIREDDFRFADVLAKAAKSEFLRSGKWFSFDWLIENQSNYLKVLEGNYDPKPAEKTQAHEQDKAAAKIEQALQSRA